MILFFSLLIVQYFIVRKSVEWLFHFLHRVVPNPLPYVIISILFFPGTVIHELAHFFTGIILFLKVRGLHLLPEWSGNHIVLGHVTYERADFFRGFLVGIAPLPAALITLWATYQWLVIQGGQGWQLALFFYLSFAITSTMFSSKSDLTDGAAFLLFAGLVIVILFFFQINVFSITRDFLFSQTTQTAVSPFFNLLTLFLTIGIAIHLFIFLFFRFVYYRFLAPKR